ncbi:hypothetical protein [Micromonospora sicca]|uniref:hypothetical protein n=1 Tax=Micromonospora sicca TaxID=2202420 RepID=UPI001F1C0738|nr:hypothetical protein [Micromonospora sp. 4G51]
MLPVALTCPLWWVARWTARMLASLAVAVAVACSLGAATLPVGAAAAAQAAPVTELASAVPAPSWSTTRPALQLGARAVPEPGDRPEDAGRAPSGATAFDAGLVLPGGTTADRGRVARASTGAAAGDVVAGTGQQALPVGSGSPLAAWRTVVAAVSKERVPRGTAPAALGSRAPPTR